MTDAATDTFKRTGRVWPGTGALGMLRARCLGPRAQGTGTATGLASRTRAPRAPTGSTRASHARLKGKGKVERRVGTGQDARTLTQASLHFVCGLQTGGNEAAESLK